MRLPPFDPEPYTRVADAASAAGRLRELEAQGHAPPSALRTIRHYLAERAQPDDLKALARLATLGPQLVARRAQLREHRAALRRGEIHPLTEATMSHLESDDTLPSLADLARNRRGAQATEDAGGEALREFLAALVGDCAAARTAILESRALAAEWAGELAAVARDLNAWASNEPGRLGLALTHARSAWQNLSSQITESDRDAERIARVEATTFTDPQQLRPALADACRVLEQISGRPRAMRGFMDTLRAAVLNVRRYGAKRQPTPTVTGPALVDRRAPTSGYAVSSTAERRGAA